MNDGTSDRFHLGMISQTLEKAMQEVGIDSKELAALVIDPVYAEKLKDQDGNEIDEYDTSSEVIDNNYFIRYEEFIPLIIDKVQKQQAVINDQANKITELENRLASIEEILARNGIS
jgi:iron-sulfur cluster repair protein YtfE (RIC family)